jgi:hypothetical protein
MVAVGESRIGTCGGTRGRVCRRGLKAPMGRPEVAKCTPGVRRTYLAGERTSLLVRILLEPSERAKRAGAFRHGFMMGHIKSEMRRGPRPGFGIAMGPPAWRPIKPLRAIQQGGFGPKNRHCPSQQGQKAGQRPFFGAGDRPAWCPDPFMWPHDRSQAQKKASSKQMEGELHH